MVLGGCDLPRAVHLLVEDPAPVTFQHQAPSFRSASERLAQAAPEAAAAVSSTRRCTARGRSQPPSTISSVPGGPFGAEAVGVPNTIVAGPSAPAWSALPSRTRAAGAATRSSAGGGATASNPPPAPMARTVKAVGGKARTATRTSRPPGAAARNCQAAGGPTSTRPAGHPAPGPAPQ